VVTNLSILSGGTHDWNWKLARLSLLPYTRLIVEPLYFVGFLLSPGSMVGMYMYAFQEDASQEKWIFIQIMEQNESKLKEKSFKR